jgi:hypothetical protein
MDAHTLAVGLLLFFNWPFCFLIRKFVPPTYRKHVNLLLGLISGFAIYRLNMFLVIAGSLLTYIFFHLPGAYCLFSLVVPFIGLTAVHLDRLWHYNKTEWGSDLSAIVMFHTLRVLTLAFNIYDGRCAEVKRKQWSRVALPAVPSLYNYFSYMFCFMGLISGPVYPLRIYEECCEMESTPEKVDADAKDGFRTLCQSIFFVTVHLLSNYFLPNRYIESDDFRGLPYFVRLFLTVCMGFGRNMRYVFAWLAAEAAFRTFGLTRVPDFDFEEIRSIRMGKLMASRDLGEMLNEWHYTVATTLKEYLYLRLIVYLRCPALAARGVVFGFSAYWHGFFSGYYTLASMGAIFSVVDRYRRVKFSPIVGRVGGAEAERWFNVVFTQIMGWFVTAPWDLLWAPRYFAFYKGMWFGPLVACFVMCGVGFAVGGGREPRKPGPKTE